MYSNNTSSNQQFSLCQPESTICLSPSIEWTIISVNIISGLVNILHFVVLSKIPQLKATAYGAILKALCITDLYFVIPTILQTNCSLRNIVTYHFRLGIFFQVLTGWVVYLRPLMLAFASCERFLALYRPFLHETSKFVQHVWLWLIFCLLGALTFAVRDIMMGKEFACVDTVVGVNSCTNNSASQRCAISVALPSAIMTTFLMLVLVQIRKMNRVQVTGNQNKDLRKAALYVLAMVFVYYFCFSVTIVDKVVLWSIDRSLTNLRLIGLLLNSLYGILNTIVYGWITPSYRRLTIQLCTSCQGKV